MEYLYVIAAIASAVSASLAWAAKLWWSKEHIAAKDEIIRTKDSQIELLESQVKSLQELSPMKIREYFLSVREQLEEYIESLQSNLREAETQIELKDSQIELLQAEGSKRESEIEEVEVQRKLLLAKYDNLSHQVERVSKRSDSAVVSSDLSNLSLANAPRLFEIISHELSSAIVGIRNNISFLHRRLSQMDKEEIRAKLEDVMTDSEILKVQINTLQQTFGMFPRVSRVARCSVVRDIVIKTVQQLKPVVHDRGFDVRRVEYDPADADRIILEVDKVRLSQVVYNILLNSIKYAEPDAAKFRIRIRVRESDDNFIVIFEDWGIGVKPEFQEQIFQDGFRAPEAVSKHVIGSGLGLTIARNFMRDIGGDLILTKNRNPTEFQLFLPKSARR
jgi:signal transduction histidine kinase